MPSYAGTGQAQLLYENTQKYLWQNETVATSTLSLAYELRRVLSTFYPWGLSFEVIFSGNPGTFEIDIMGANNDIAVNYVQIGTITVTNANVDANSVFLFGTKTAASPAAFTVSAVTIGTSFAVTCGSGDTSVYNYIILG